MSLIKHGVDVLHCYQCLPQFVQVRFNDLFFDYHLNLINLGDGLSRLCYTLAGERSNEVLFFAHSSEHLLSFDITNDLAFEGAINSCLRFLDIHKNFIKVAQYK